jgi:hypothetical protein
MKSSRRCRAEYDNYVLVVAERNGQWFADVIRRNAEIAGFVIWGIGGFEPPEESKVFGELREAQEYACRLASILTGRNPNTCDELKVRWEMIRSNTSTSLFLFLHERLCSLRFEGRAERQL